MSLIEQKKAYMAKLSDLLAKRQNEIEAKVAEFRASLEKEKLTDEMKTLVKFINELDAMMKYDSGEDVEENSDEEVEEQADDEIDEDEELLEEDDVEDDSFSEEDEEVDEEEIDEDANVEQDDIGISDVLNALDSDHADTRAKLEAAENARPGMPTVVNPRR